MKKVLFLAAVMVASLASCKKDYTCVCKDSGQTFATYTIKTTKKKSKDTCKDNEAAWKAYSSTVTCEIQ
ncbi:MAG TPA: hypothetical protein VF868_07835 [Bacteroidia bacterium]|jgi:hypothetical protein